MSVNVAFTFFQYPLYVGVIFGICWCVLVSTSRLYMGMHTLQVGPVLLIYIVLVFSTFYYLGGRNLQTAKCDLLHQRFSLSLFLNQRAAKWQNWALKSVKKRVTKFLPLALTASKKNEKESKKKKKERKKKTSEAFSQSDCRLMFLLHLNLFVTLLYAQWVICLTPSKGTWNLFLSS